jgi:4-hydroxybenzoate polyprenyltransferase
MDLFKTLDGVDIRKRRTLLRALVLSARPVQLLKTVVAVGWGQYCADSNNLELSGRALLTLLGMLILSAGLYGLNDIADLGMDRRTLYKKCRPLPAGSINTRQLFIFSAVQLGVALSVLAGVSFITFAWAIILIANQICYSFEPIRLKRRFALDVISAALLSHGARFAVGFRGGRFSMNTVLACAALVLWKVAAYLTYRLTDNPACDEPETDTTHTLGVRNITYVSAAAFLISYVCFGLYAFRSHMGLFASTFITTLYATAFILYLIFTKLVSVGNPWKLLVFSAIGQSK